jgi:hypothetical protein
MSATKRKTEDSADGCRGRAQDDRARAAAMTSGHMRTVLERSAGAWSARARLLERLDKDFNRRAASAQTRNPGRTKIEDEANG